MKQNLYLVTTKKELFHVASSTMQQAALRAETYILSITTPGVTPESITEIKYVGNLLVST
jgi:hypothetical protein